MITQKEVLESRWMELHYPVLHLKINTFSKRAHDILTKSESYSLSITEPPFSYYIYGEIGTGKTIFALRRVLDICGSFYVINKKPTIRIELTTVAEFLQRVRNSYTKNSIETEKEILERFQNADVVLFDDFGVEVVNDWSFQILYMVISYRNAHLKSTIYTSNYSLEDISQKLGDDRLTSRIQQDCQENILYTGTKNKRI